jgi:glutamate dehydrogenase
VEVFDRSVLRRILNLAHLPDSAIVDGSGVLHDPNGIDRSELTRLAKARQTVSNVDRSKIGPGGYLILLEDKGFVLPCECLLCSKSVLVSAKQGIFIAVTAGEVIADGLTFRNTAHLRFKADMFVPCGGRPQAINLSNVNQLFDAEGKCHFKYIVEGANLFITQEARERLESKGIELYKDSSANKGGVTSSSQEVLAGLALNDEEYIANMLFKDGAPTPFYEAYVKDIQALIARNASAEFVALNKEYARHNGKVLRTRIADELASALNNLQAELETSALYEQVESRKNVLARAFPKTLIDFVGLDKLLERLPEPVSRRSFGTRIDVPG